MTKELSKQLCDLCGVEPHYRCTNVPCLNFTEGICNITDKKCNVAKCNSYKPDTNHKSWKEGTAIYPDFGKPNNFVKLLELLYNIEGYYIVDLFIYVDIATDSLAKDSIKVLIQQLNNTFGWGDDFINSIKQAIKNTEWEY